jgi:transposase
MSRNAAAKRFGVSIASAVRWVCRFNASGETSPAPTGGDQRSHRIEALATICSDSFAVSPISRCWKSRDG